MATKKQRRRRAKEHRHEYVWVDDEGNEVDAPEEGTEKRETRAGGSRRDPQEPSWQRSFRRGAIFAPIMFVVVYFLQKDKSLPAAAVQTGFLLALFIPFSYVMDSLMYRSFRKRSARAKDGGTAARR